MDNTKTTLNIKYAEIKVHKFAQYDIEIEAIKDESLVEFQSNFQFNFSDKEELVSCLVIVYVKIIETGEVFAELKVDNIFEIKPFKSFIKVNGNDDVKIPDAILHNLVSLSISTVRGILFERLKGTMIQKLVYPLINSASIFKQKNPV